MLNFNMLDPRPAFTVLQLADLEVRLADVAQLERDAGAVAEVGVELEVVGDGGGGFACLVAGDDLVAEVGVVVCGGFGVAAAGVVVAVVAHGGAGCFESALDGGDGAAELLGDLGAGELLFEVELLCLGEGEGVDAWCAGRGGGPSRCLLRLVAVGHWCGGLGGEGGE